MFSNRQDAGRQLARALAPWRDSQPVVLGLPRGGVVVAAEIAKALGGILDVLLVRKLRAPGNPELAIGAISETGGCYINLEIANLAGATDSYLATEREKRRAEMAAQCACYRPVRPLVPVAGRVVILVDDGLATGATMIAGVQALALSKPGELVVAVPVSPPETLSTIRNLASVTHVVCLHAPADFQGVGQFYNDFTQTSDAEVMALLSAG